MRRVVPLVALAAACEELGPDDPDAWASTTGPDHCGTITGEEVWAADLNPHTVSCGVSVEAGGHLTIAPGTEVRVGSLKSITATGTGGEVTWEVLGTEADPVLLTLDGDPSVDSAWYGIGAYDTQDDDLVSFRHTLVEFTGPPTIPTVPWGALEADAATVEVDHLTLRDHDGFGFYLTGGAGFADGSRGLVVTGATTSGLVESSATHSVPEDGAALTGNGWDVVIVKGSGSEVNTSQTWDDLGVPYQVTTDHGGSILVEGVDGEPAVLTLGAGVRLQFAGSTGLSVSASGNPGALSLRGTEERPVVVTGGDASGGEVWWHDLSLSDAAVDEDCVFEHFTLGYGGTTGWTSGTLVLRGASPTLRDGLIHDSATYGIDLDAASDPVLDDVVFADNASGDTNR